MARLGLKHLRPLIGFTQDLYRRRDLDAFRKTLLTGIAAVVPAEITSYVEVDLENRRSRTWVEPSALLDRRHIFERHMHEHPVLDHVNRTGDGRALKVSDFLTRSQFRRLGLYNEHYRPLGVEHMIGIGFPPAAPSIRAMGLLRSRADFSEDERAVLNLLRPHLIMSHESAQVVSRLGSDHRSAGGGAGAAGVIMLTLLGRIQSSSPTARQWLTKYFGPYRHAASSLPERLEAWVKHNLRRLTAKDTLPDAATPLVIEREPERLSVRLVIDDRHPVLLLNECSLMEPQRLLQKVGLTKREAEVLAWVADGKTNADIGTILSTSPRTVAKHLERIFPKLGVETRTAAAARFFSMTPSLVL